MSTGHPLTFYTIPIKTHARDLRRLACYGPRSSILSIRASDSWGSGRFGGVVKSRLRPRSRA